MISYAKNMIISLTDAERVMRVISKIMVYVVHLKSNHTNAIDNNYLHILSVCVWMTVI